ncbi:hypothetical protein NTE19_003341 [Vibrio fluvialis]|nr:hypothetical protein [Vibrio fluvialis]
MAELKPRFSQHSAFNAVVRADWVVAINNDPENWTARLFLPVESDIPQEVSGNFEIPQFTELDNNQKPLSYGDPILVKVADVRQDMTRLFASSGKELLSYGDGNMSIRIGYDPVPVGAMLEWEEETTDGNLSEVSWYVHSAETFGTQKAAVIYELISNGDISELVTSEEELVDDSEITEDDILDMT